MKSFYPSMEHRRYHASLETKTEALSLLSTEKTSAFKITSSDPLLEDLQKEKKMYSYYEREEECYPDNECDGCYYSGECRESREGRGERCSAYITDDEYWEKEDEKLYDECEEKCEGECEICPHGDNGEDDCPLELYEDYLKLKGSREQGDASDQRSLEGEQI